MPIHPAGPGISLSDITKAATTAAAKAGAAVAAAEVRAAAALHDTFETVANTRVHVTAPAITTPHVTGPTVKPASFGVQVTGLGLDRGAVLLPSVAADAKLPQITLPHVELPQVRLPQLLVTPPERD